MRSVSTHLLVRSVSTLLAGAGAVALVALGATSAAADTISVDDLDEGEAGAFVNVSYNSCGALPGGENLAVLINGEDTEGVQYALSTESLRQGETQTFLFHAGGYRITVSTGQFVASKDVTVADVSDTTVLMSDICRNVETPPKATTVPTVTATVAAVRTPNRVEPGEAAVDGGGPLDDVGIGLGALALVAGGLVAARTRRSTS